MATREALKIKFSKRENTGKGICRKLRTKGIVPAVFYGPDYKESLVGTIDERAVARAANSLNWETNMIDLELPDGKVEMALLRNVQRHVITQKILHVDLYQLVKGHKVKVSVPFRVVNKETCAGVKMGGQLEQYMRDVDILVLPREIPGDIELDVIKMAMGETLTLADINFPESAEVLLPPETVVVAVNRPRAMADDAVTEGELGGEETAEVEVVGRGKKKEDEE